MNFEADKEKQLEMSGFSGPPANQKEMFMSLSDLEIELVGLDLLIAQETESNFNESKYHQGLSAVIQVVAERAA